MKISNAKAFRTLLENAAGGLTLPAHGDVENIEILYANSSEGFVVTYIPTALNIPLQTLYPGDKQEFYIRAGSNFLPTPRGVLASLFGRSPQADFDISVTKTTFEGNVISKEARFNFQIFVRNCGRGITRDVFLTIDRRSKSQTQLMTYVLSTGIDYWMNANTPLYSSNTYVIKDFIFPPGTTRSFVNFSLIVNGEQSSDIVVKIYCGGSGCAGRVKEILIPWQDINDAYSHYVTNYPNIESKRAGDTECEQLIMRRVV